VGTATAIALAFCLLGAGCNAQHKPKPATIGINQFMQHPVLDEVAKGILDEFKDQGITEANGYKVVYKNANGDQTVAVQINKMLVNDKVDVIIPMGTPAAQSACKETTTIPVVFGAITDPVKAGIAESLEHPGKNRTGMSNRWPFEKQVGLIKQVVPKAVSVGMVINPSEANTQAGLSYIRPALQRAGLKAVEVPVASSSEVLNAAKSLVGRCDVFYVTPDNTLIGGFDALVKVARENKIPIIGGSEDLVKKGSLASYAPDHYRLGRATAKMVLEILREHKDPGSMPVILDNSAPLIINEAEAAKIGISLPEELRSAAKR
jgi:putative ABC transport system substrate-binding protein